MIKKTKLNIQIKATLILLMFLVMSAYFNFSIDTSDTTTSSKKENDVKGVDPDIINTPKLSDIGLDEWVDESFRYRMLINTTNPYDHDFIDYGASIEFEYTDLVSSSKMQSDLDDIRIVESFNGVGYLRNYFYIKNYPSTGIVTVWFETNITKGPDHLEQDTYIYYGNNTVGKANNYFIDERFGTHWWDFEEGSGSVIDDKINVNNGELIGNTDWNTESKMGNYALELDGSSDYVQLATPYTYLNNVTVSAWVKTTDTKGIVLSYDRSEIFRFGIGSSGTQRRVTWNTDAPGGYDDRSGNTNVNDDQWHFIAATYNDYDLTKTIFVDGKIDGGPWSYTPPVDPPQLGTGITRYGFLGTGSESSTYGDGKNTPNDWYDGLLDDLRMHDIALTEQEMSWMYNLSNPLETELNEEHAFTATVEVTAIDFYDNYIPNANISIYNKTADPINPLESKIADSQGKVQFTDLPIGYYNFSVTLTSNYIDYTILVNETTDPFLFEGIFNSIDLICDASNHNFTILDVDGKPVESGWVYVGNETQSTNIIQKCPIDENGKARFWWLNDTSNGYLYNYTVQYQNDDFVENIITLGVGSLATPNEARTVDTLLTTINFTVYAHAAGPSLGDPIPGARLNLTNYDTREHIGNITTDQNGKAILRWLNSTGIADSGDDNYELRIFFWAPDLQFNITAGETPPSHKFWDFTISSENSYILRLLVDPSDYQTRIDSLNPTDSISATWGTQLKLRYLFNFTLFTGKPEEEGPAYADSMQYAITGGPTGSFEQEEDYIGRHTAIIDTTLLTPAATAYTIIITAEKSGFTTPEQKTFSLIIEENDVEVVQILGADSELNVHWDDLANITVNPYGINYESFEMKDIVFQDSNNFQISIPDIITEWNLSQIVLNLYNVNYNEASGNENVNITDDFGTKHVFDNTDGIIKNYGIGAPNGSWENIIINLNKKSILSNNRFDFDIVGTFDGTLDIIADVSFKRDIMNVQYSSFNVTNTIDIFVGDSGWAIQNITFEITNCYRTSDWNPYNLSDPNALNITTDEGYEYSLDSGTPQGTGILTIDDRTIYPLPLEEYISFLIDNSTNIVFDVIIKVEYVQSFYMSNFLDINTLTITDQINAGGTLQISYTGKDWSDSDMAILKIENIFNGTQHLYPSDIGMTITLGGQTFSVEDVDDGEGQFNFYAYSLFSKEAIYRITIQSTDPNVNFDLSYLVGNTRTYTYLISTNIDYDIEGDTGTLIYDSDLGYHKGSIDTNPLTASTRPYVIEFTVTNPNYDPQDLEQTELDLYVLERESLINGQSIGVQLITSIKVQTEIRFLFTYVDEVLGTNITQLDEKRFDWQQQSGSVLIASGEGELSADSQNRYVLDFNTELRAVGSYLLSVTLKKENYESKTAYISLQIDERDIDYDLGDMFDDKQVSVVKGKTIVLEIELLDDLTGDPLTDADVVLEIGDDEFEFDEKDDGIYELEFSTKDYEAFFTSNTITGTIKVVKANYTDEEIDITIVVEMEEVTEGVPTFYFIIAVAAIAAIVGSLGAYRYIQVARIPTFVKKARKVKKSIKSGDKVSEALMYPLKEEYLVKTLDDKYKSLGLSLDDLLGLKGKGKSEDTLKKNGGVK